MNRATYLKMKAELRRLGNGGAPPSVAILVCAIKQTLRAVSPYITAQTIIVSSKNGVIFQVAMPILLLVVQQLTTINPNGAANTVLSVANLLAGWHGICAPEPHNHLTG